VLDPPGPPAGTVTGVGTTVGTVATGEEDSTAATVLTTAGVDASFPPAAEDATGEATEELSVGRPAALEVAGVEPSTGVDEVAGVELPTGAADDAGVVDPAGATPHWPRGLLPGNASKVPRIVSSMGH
jgi:hypothetical protein